MGVSIRVLLLPFWRGRQGRLRRKQRVLWGWGGWVSGKGFIHIMHSFIGFSSSSSSSISSSSSSYVPGELLATAHLLGWSGWVGGRVRMSKTRRRRTNLLLGRQHSQPPTHPHPFTPPMHISPHTARGWVGINPTHPPTHPPTHLHGMAPRAGGGQRLQVHRGGRRHPFLISPSPSSSSSSSSLLFGPG